MPYFQNIFDRLGLLPNLKQEGSDSGASSSGLSLAERLDRQRMSPNTRTKAWLNSHSPQKSDQASRSQTPSVLGVTGGKVSKQVTTPKSNIKSAIKSATKSATKSVKFGSEPDTKKKRFSLWDTLLGIRYKTNDEVAPPPKSEERYEGITLIEDEVTVVSTDGCDFEGDTIVQDQEGDLHKEDEHDFSDFTKEEYFLFHKLNARGYEPILNITWHWHFPTLPADLFTNDETKAYISHTKGPEYHGESLPPDPAYSSATDSFLHSHEVP